LKEQMLREQGFVYDPMRMLWVNGVARKAVSKEAVDDHGAEEIRSWIHSPYPADQRWSILLAPASTPERAQQHAEQIAADLGWK